MLLHKLAKTSAQFLRPCYSIKDQCRHYTRQISSKFKIGQVVTADLPPSVGSEKRKRRPVVVIGQMKQTVQVVAMQDAVYKERNERIMPTHMIVRAYNSGSVRKDSVITCEDFWSVCPSRLSARNGARALGRDHIKLLRPAVRDLLGLDPVKGRLKPRICRGDIVPVLFEKGIGSEVSGLVQAVVISNDIRNHFGGTLIVAPFSNNSKTVAAFRTPQGVVDMGQTRIADLGRLQGSRSDAMLAESVNAIADAIVGMLFK